MKRTLSSSDDLRQLKSQHTFDTLALISLVEKEPKDSAKTRLKHAAIGLLGMRRAVVAAPRLAELSGNEFKRNE